MPVTDSFGVRGYVVAFVDLLGSGKQLSAMRDVMGEPEDKRLELVRDAFMPIKHLRDSFGNYWTASREMQYPARPHLTAQQRARLQNLLAESLSIQQFADSLLVSVCIFDDGEAAPLGSVQSLLLGCAAMMPYMLASECPIRGGVDIGFESDGFIRGEVISSAQAGAVGIESSRAQWPRVVVSRELVHYLSESAAQAGSSDRDRYNRAMAKLCCDVVGRDIDGEWILDYLAPEVRKRLSGADYEDLVENACGFVMRRHTSFLDAVKRGDLTATKHAMRYHLLRGYFERSGYPP